MSTGTDPSDLTWECYVTVECHPKHGDDDDPLRFATKPVESTRERAAASVLREFADELQPIEGPAYDEGRFFYALDCRREQISRLYDYTPVTRDILLRELDSLAQAFGVEWYGVRGM